MKSLFRNYSRIIADGEMQVCDKPKRVSSAEM